MLLLFEPALRFCPGFLQLLCGRQVGGRQILQNFERFIFLPETQQHRKKIVIIIVAWKETPLVLLFEIDFGLYVAKQR
jgi:hypothetical protein